MRVWRELSAALAVVAASLGADFALGRESAAFYAQMAGASWVGVAASGAMFGLIVAMVAWLERRCAAANLFALLRRTPGGRLGWIGCALYALILLLSCASLIDAAGHLGELMLPLRHASRFGVALSLLLSAWFALGGAGGLRTVGAAFLALLTGYEIALCRFARLDALPGVPFVLELRLADSIPAALCFATLHAAMCAFPGVGVALRAARKGARPATLGGCCAAIFCLPVLLGNAALRAHRCELLALDAPFVALASCWGSAGFWLSAAVASLATVTSLAGLMTALLPPKRASIERRFDGSAASPSGC